MCRRAQWILSKFVWSYSFYPCSVFIQYILCMPLAEHHTEPSLLLFVCICSPCRTVSSSENHLLSYLARGVLLVFRGGILSSRSPVRGGWCFWASVSFIVEVTKELLSNQITSQVTLCLELDFPSYKRLEVLGEIF